jgi:hypothetical protein
MISSGPYCAISDRTSGRLIMRCNCRRMLLSSNSTAEFARVCRLCVSRDEFASLVDALAFFAAGLTATSLLLATLRPVHPSAGGPHFCSVISRVIGCRPIFHNIDWRTAASGAKRTFAKTGGAAVPPVSSSITVTVCGRRSCATLPRPQFRNDLSGQCL